MEIIECQDDDDLKICTLKSFQKSAMNLPTTNFDFIALVFGRRT